MGMRFLAIAAMLTCACSAAPAAQGPKPSRFHGPLLYYPIEQNVQWSYMFRDVTGGLGVFSVTRVVSFDGTNATLLQGKETIELQLAPDGIVQSKTGAYLLKVPFALGDKWSGGPGASIEVTKVDAAITVEAGSYAHCVETTETFHGDAVGTLTTTYCPDVGPVKLDLRDVDEQGVPEEAIATLRSYGPPVDLGVAPSKGP